MPCTLVTYNLSDYGRVNITLDGRNTNVGTITVVFKSSSGLIQSISYTAPGNASGVSAGQGKDATSISWVENTVLYSYSSFGYNTPTTLVQSVALPFVGVPGTQFTIYYSNGLPGSTNTNITGYTYTSSYDSPGNSKLSGYLGLLDSTYINKGQNYQPNFWWSQKNPFGAPDINAPVTSLFRQFNNVEYISTITGNEGFATLNPGNTSGNFATVSLDPGTYQITAGGTLLQASTHCVGLVEVTNGVTPKIIATGTICNSNNTSLGNSNTSTVTTRWTTTGYNTTNASIGLLHAFTAHSANIGTAKAPEYNYASLGRPLQATPVTNTLQYPSWISEYLPYVTTAWMDIEKIS